MGENFGRYEGIIDGLTKLVIGPRRDPDSRTKYRIDVGDLGRTLAIEQDLLVLTDADGGALMQAEGRVSSRGYSPAAGSVCSRSVCEGRIGRE